MSEKPFCAEVARNMNLWKYLLTHSSSKNQEEGFTLPLILGFGLFMLAVGLTSIKMSSTSEVTSTIQKKTLQASAAAEMGVSRIQQILDNDRIIAVYNDCVSGRDSTTLACNDTTQPSWSKASNITIPAGEKNSCLQQAVKEVTTVTSIARNTAWQDASATDPSMGQFRLVSYTYTPNPGVAAYKTPGVAVLQVEGRTSQFASNATNPRQEVMNTGTARLRVEIPIRSNKVTLMESVPGLWMKFNTDANMGTQKVIGSILIEDTTCAAGGSIPTGLSQTNNIATVGGVATGTITATPMAMPPTPNLPPDSRLNKIQGYEIFANNGVLPRAGDVQYQGAYHYLVPSLEHAGGSGVVISGSTKIILYVQGPIDLAGGINNGVAPQNLQIYGNTTVTAGTGRIGTSLNSTNYKYGCDKVVSKVGKTSENTCPTKTIKLAGTADLNAFIHAPEAWACLNGGGSDPSITGALWINQWTSTTANLPPDIPLNTCTNKDAAVIDFNTVSFPVDSVLGSPQRITITEPQISPVTSWERQSR